MVVSLSPLIINTFSTSEAFSQLSSSHSGLQWQVDPYDLNSFWLSPLVYFRDVETRLSVLVATIEDTINAADILEVGLSSTCVAMVTIRELRRGGM